ncbi:MAG: molybdopterin-guanine dinucleotide biosynthesis protein B [Candidatus Aminicenantes bacterium]|nr:molybdopterin-guanine dinucleotide biosynthesis protein B [Candidatus Aminicenantes bacterium]
MKIIAFVGDSNTGKTHLIKRLVAEWKQRGRSVAVIKHCSHGFSLDIEGKDTWQFMEAGADGVSMLSPDRLAVLIKTGPVLDFNKVARTYFPESDIVIVEGGREAENIRKIEVVGRGKSEVDRSKSEDLLAIVTDTGLGVGIPEFQPNQIKELVDFVDNLLLS